MSPRSAILLLDIDGVLLSNGWDRTGQQQTAQSFGPDYEETSERHHFTVANHSGVLRFTGGFGLRSGISRSALHLSSAGVCCVCTPPPDGEVAL